MTPLINQGGESQAIQGKQPMSAQAGGLPLEHRAESGQHAEPNYIAIFIYLAVLTALELAVYAARLPKPVTIGCLVLLAFAKATLVAMYFMHLALERKGLWVVALTPVLLIAFVYLMVRPDLSTRLWAHTGEHQVVGHHDSGDGNGPGKAPAPVQAQQ